MSEWIDIKEREPDYDSDVLVTNGRRIAAAWLYPIDATIKKWFVSNSVTFPADQINFEPTHWKPVELPKEGEE